MVDNRLVVLVGTVGKVHANNVKTGPAESRNHLDRVGLRTNGADDGRTTVVSVGKVLDIQGTEPLEVGIGAV